MKKVLSILFAMALAIPAMAVKSLPYGIYWLRPVCMSGDGLYDNPHKWAVWNDPYSAHIVGVVARVSWEELEPQDGVYRWDYLDAVDSLCGPNGGFYYQISVHCGMYKKDQVTNQFWPQWLATEGCQIITLHDTTTTPEYPDGIPVQIPVPWDPVFQAKWQAFITARGARYDGKYYLHSVQMAGCGRQASLYLCGTSADWTWLQSQGGIPIYTNAAATIASYYATAFPRTPFLWSVGRPIQVAGADPGNSAMNTIATQANNAYNMGAPWRCGFRDSGYQVGSGGNVVNIPVAFIGYQEIGPFGDATAVVNQATSQAGTWLECYEGDCTNSVNFTAFDQFNSAKYNPNQSQ
jgi:hypothetical protein